MNVHSEFIEYNMDKKEAIFKAALKLFSTRGYYGVAVPLIAQKARVGVGTIYRYFKSKKDLVNKLYIKLKKDIINSFNLKSIEGKTTREIFHIVWSSRLDYAMKNEIEMNFLELHHHASYLSKECRELDETYYKLVKDFYNKGKEEGTFIYIETETLIAVVWGIFNESIKWYWNKQLDLTEEKSDKIEEIAWKAILK